MTKGSVLSSYSSRLFLTVTQLRKMCCQTVGHLTLCFCSFVQPRLRCLAHIVRKLDNPVLFIQEIIPEVSFDHETLLKVVYFALLFFFFFSLVSVLWIYHTCPIHGHMAPHNRRHKVSCSSCATKLLLFG